MEQAAFDVRDLDRCTEKEERDYSNKLSDTTMENTATPHMI